MAHAAALASMKLGWTVVDKKHGFLDPSMVEGDIIQGLGLELEGYVVVSLCSASRDSPHNMYIFSCTATAKPLEENLEW
jgi:hypothetical protein